MAKPATAPVPTERVAAAIVSYHRINVLDTSLAAMLGQSTPPGAVTVVDIASSDGTVEVVRNNYADVVLASMAENTGAAGGFAEALRVAHELGYDWTWIFNDDDEPDPHALETMLDSLAGLPDRTRLLACVRFNAGGQYCSPSATRKHRQREIPFTTPGGTIPANIIAFSGTLISSQVVAEVGLQRAEFIMMMVDQDFCLRARRKGWEIHVVAQPLVKSMTSGSVGRAPARRGNYRTSTRRLMARDRRSAPEGYWWGARTLTFSAASMLSGREGPRRIRFRLRGAWDGLSRRGGSNGRSRDGKLRTTRRSPDLMTVRGAHHDRCRFQVVR